VTAANEPIPDAGKVVALIAALKPMLTAGRMITISDVTLVTGAERGDPRTSRSGGG
jgi:hypothetical protein